MKTRPSSRAHALWLALAAALATASCDDDATTQPPVVSPGPDLYPPQAVEDLALSFDPAADAVRFAWTAPRDDIARDRVDHYDIRYGYSFPFDWNRAAPAPSPPEPVAQGGVQAYALADPVRGRDLFAAVRAVDAAGNVSPVGTIAHVRVPGHALEVACADALTGGPVGGLECVVAARFTYTLHTGDDGRFAIDDLGEGALALRIARGTAAAPYHTFSDAFAIESDVTRAYAMIPWQSPVSPLFESILALVREALVTPGSSEVVRNWKQLPIPWYAPEFVNVHGVDYGALVAQAAQRWNDRTGLALFVAADAPPASGVVIQFPARSVMGVQNGVTDHTNDAEGFPLLDRIRIVDDFADPQKLYTIMMHELGHTIRLGHLPAGFLMFGGQPLPGDITDDEVAAVRLLTSLPALTDLAGYDSAPPVP